MKKVICLVALLFTGAVYCNAQMKPNWFFRDELMEGLEHAKDTVYVFDRTKLEKLAGLHKKGNEVQASYRSSNGERIGILITSAQFDSSKHEMSFAENDLVDGMRSYGTDRTIPRTAIGVLKITRGGKQLKIAKSAYANLFDPHLSSIEAYLSKNKSLLFIYLSGSDGAGSYSVKFVFDNHQYLTRLITTIECTNGYDFLDATVDKCDE